MYLTVAQYKTWADARGYTYGDDAAIEAAITIATDFIDMNYTFKGTPQQGDLQLPTDQVAIEDILKGAAQATYQQLQGRLLVDPASLSQAGQVVSDSKSVGTLKKSVSYAEGYQYTTTFPTRMIDLALKPYLVGGGLSNAVVRG